MSGLRKADDADLHPSTPAHVDEPSLRRAGAATSDAVLREGKTVKVDVRIPKALRRKLRKEADRRGVAVDEIVIQALSQHLS